MTRQQSPGGTFVLDSQGLSETVARTRNMAEWLALARADDLNVVVSAATLVEVVHPRISRSALQWTLSRLVVVPVTQSLSRHAADLLHAAGRHGHQHAIDAMVAATALSAEPPVTVFTSDLHDIAALCGSSVAVITI